MLFLRVIVFVVLICNSYERTVNSLSISSANNHLALQLLQHLYSDESNIFFSPFSISTAFAMLYLGANNSTADELREVLGYNFGNLTIDDVNQQIERVLHEISGIDLIKNQLNSANKLMAQKDFNILRQRTHRTPRYYQTSTDSVDFVRNAVKTMNAINAWVKQQTHENIPKLLSQPLSKDTRLALLNAIYFKADWQTKFAKNETVKEVFYNMGVESFTAEMMKRNGKFNFTIIAELDSQLLELPYAGDAISMYILLPHDVDSFGALKSKLINFETIESAITKLREANIRVSIPKFKFETSYSLPKPLSELGMRQVFSSAAHLSGIDGKHDLSVSDVIHRAVVEVNEEGSEATDVTAMSVTKTGAVVGQPIIGEFKANHPFVFFIRHNINGMILFAGHVNRL